MKTRCTPRARFFLTALSTALLAGGRSASRAGEESDGLGPAAIFETSKVWNVELELAPEAHDALEPRGGPGRGPRPGGPGFARRFDPSGMLAPLLIGEGDGDKDGDLDRAELLALGARWLETWDREKSGKLDEEEIAAGLDSASSRSPQGPANAPRGPRGFGMNLQGPEGKRNGVASAMGIDFEYVRGTLGFDGRKLEEVGIRYKGNGTYLQSRGSPKISFKVDTNRFVKGRKLGGVTKLNLHSNVTDPTWLNEVLSHELFRDAGVPAPRTSFARVHLTVPGRHEKRFLGLYTLVENVDGNFTAEAFRARGGAIFKPVTPDLFADLGDDWKAYNQAYDPKNEPDDAAKQRIVDLSKLVTHAGDEDFARRIGEYIDIPELASFMAVLVCLADMDGILGPGQNFYIHLHPETRKLAFIPWDLDHSFGQFAMRGTQEERENLSIERPWGGRNRFLERIFALEAFRAPYRAKLAELTAALFVPGRIASRIDELARAIRPGVAEESAEKLERFDQAIAGELPAGPAGFGFRGGPMRPARSFVKARHASLVEQLAGRSPGLVIGGSEPGGLARRVDGGRPGEVGRPGRAERSGPGRLLARTLLGAMDADADRQASRDELDAGFRKWLGSWDADGNGALVAEEMRAGLERTGQAGLAPAPPDDRVTAVRPIFDTIPFQGGPIRVGGPPGPGGGRERTLLPRFDADGNGRLDLAERTAARAEMRGGGGRFPGRRGGRGPVELRDTEQRQGLRLSPDGVPVRTGGNLFNGSVLRTYFFELEAPDWEQELEDFYRTDVRVPAKMTVDGKVYEGVGVNFRGSSSYMMSGTGLKRSLNVRIDHTVPDQRLRGRKRLNLLNSQGDPTFVRTILYNHIASRYVPAPRSCHARVVINGESWGIYILQEELDGDFLQDRFGTRKGVRWKVSGDGGAGTFAYRGDDPEPYRRSFELKTKSGEGGWPALIELCRLLDRTPAEDLEESLSRRLDIDGTLWFLALDNALMNCDGYWVPTGDFDLYLDEEGRFHPIPRDANEAFREPGGMIAGGVQVSGPRLDPLFGIDDPRSQLISRLLAVPELRGRYIAHVRTIVEEWIDVEKLRPLIAKLQGPIENDVWADGRKLDGFQGFRADAAPAAAVAGPAFRRGGPARGLLDFVAARRAYLSSHDELEAPSPRLLSAKTGEVLPGQPVRIVVEAAPGTPVDRVILHHRSKSLGRFERVEMEREADGRFAASIPAPPADTRVEYYAEARSKAHGTAAFFPPEAESKPRRYRAR